MKSSIALTALVGSLLYISPIFGRDNSTNISNNSDTSNTSNVSNISNISNVSNASNVSNTSNPNLEIATTGLGPHVMICAAGDPALLSGIMSLAILQVHLFKNQLFLL